MFVHKKFKANNKTSVFSADQGQAINGSGFVHIGPNAPSIGRRQRGSKFSSSVLPLAAFLFFKYSRRTQKSILLPVKSLSSNKPVT